MGMGLLRRVLAVASTDADLRDCDIRIIYVSFIRKWCDSYEEGYGVRPALAMQHSTTPSPHDIMQVNSTLAIPQRMQCRYPLLAQGNC